jgi:hypothetical protein
MKQVLITIVKKVKEKFKDGSNTVWTCYTDAREARNELDAFISLLNSGGYQCLDKLSICFAPTGIFQEHSLSNGWSEDYLKLADEFDCLYSKIKSK